jgi:hypothetical protein
LVPGFALVALSAKTADPDADRNTARQTAEQNLFILFLPHFELPERSIPEWKNDSWQIYHILLGFVPGKDGRFSLFRTDTDSILVEIIFLRKNVPFL